MSNICLAEAGQGLQKTCRGELVKQKRKQSAKDETEEERRPSSVHFQPVSPARLTFPG